MLFVMPANMVFISWEMKAVTNLKKILTSQNRWTSCPRSNRAIVVAVVAVAAGVHLSTFKYI